MIIQIIPIFKGIKWKSNDSFYSRLTENSINHLTNQSINQHNLPTLWHKRNFWLLFAMSIGITNWYCMCPLAPLHGVSLKSYKNFFISKTCFIFEDIEKVIKRNSYLGSLQSVNFIYLFSAFRFNPHKIQK